jgi:tetratricopeptide (TPR) repeat protein
MEAVQAYQRAIKINASYVKAWRRLSVSLGKLGKHAQSKEALQKAVELESGKIISE